MKNIDGTNTPMKQFPRDILPTICVEVAMDTKINVVSGFHTKQQGAVADGKFGGKYLSYKILNTNDTLLQRGQRTTLISLSSVKPISIVKA